MPDPQFRFTTDPGSALLYWGDEFVAKFSAVHRAAFTVVMDRVEILIAERDEFKRMHADIVETITVIDGENTVLRTKLDEALKTIDELNEAAIDDII